MRAMRHEAGLTQSDLAARAGVSRRWLISLEQGTSGTSEVGKVFDTLRALGVSMSFADRRQRTTDNKQAKNALAAIQEIGRSRP